ncbi:MAG: hypothetical protein LZF62_410013 [Nitrospira sp.]|nr:MAG: hypothetical protein LZF62_410013 [Nitrospira sp.]
MLFDDHPVPPDLPDRGGNLRPGSEVFLALGRRGDSGWQELLLDLGSGELIQWGARTGCPAAHSRLRFLHARATIATTDSINGKHRHGEGAGYGNLDR